jgi:hypothetical protein
MKIRKAMEKGAFNKPWKQPIKKQIIWALILS